MPSRRPQHFGMVTRCAAVAPLSAPSARHARTPFAARAETWPAKPIRVILPGPVGG
jgi:hypothetical protein